MKHKTDNPIKEILELILKGHSTAEDLSKLTGHSMDLIRMYVQEIINEKGWIRITKTFNGESYHIYSDYVGVAERFVENNEYL